MLLRKSFFNGVRKGLRIYAELVVIIVPVFLIVTFLKYTPVFALIEGSLSPFLGYLGLSGKSAIVLITGFFGSFYAAVGMVPALGLSWREITILGVMVTICHEVIVEGAVLRKLRANFLRITFLRFVLAFFAGFLLNLVL